VNVIASEAKQSIVRHSGQVDCFVATLLAMTDNKRPYSSVGATSRATCTRAAISGVIGSRFGITIPML
jgi:hypothetical protein